VSKANPSLTCICLLVVLIACNAAVMAAPLFVDQKGAIPADAIVLFDGKDLSQWVKGDGSKAEWIVEKGYCQPKGGDIQTKQDFSDCQLHLEFWIPTTPADAGPERGNSGVFLNNAYEIQILDSWEQGDKIEQHSCGAIYDEVTPLVNANRPHGTWQTYDIIFHSPKFDAAGKKTANARFTVLLNGILIQDNAEAFAPTRYHNTPDMAKGPVQIQDHGHPIRMRNIWIRPLVK
jgi:hypothetical protein